MDDVVKFVDQAVIEEYKPLEVPNATTSILIPALRYNGKLPTGLIVAGPDIASHGSLFDQIAARTRVVVNGPAIVLTSGEAPNLKMALKNIIKKGTNFSHGVDDDEEEKMGPWQKVCLAPSLCVGLGLIRSKGREGPQLRPPDLARPHAEKQITEGHGSISR